MASRQLKLERLFEQGIKKVDPALGKLDLETHCSESIKALLKEFVTLRTNNCLKSAMTHFAPQKEPNWVYFDFIKDTRLNAIAFEEQNKFFIGFNAGTPLLLAGFFEHLLSFRENFTFVGNPNAERPDPKTLPYLVANCEQYGGLLGAFPCVTSSALDQERQRYAIVLTELALTFLTHHEFAHIYQGHLSLLGELARQTFIPEMRWQASDGITLMMMQAMEWDADRFAANQGYTSASAWSEGRGMPPSHYQAFFQNPQDGMFTWLIAIYLLFRLMTAGEDVALQTSQSHPPPQVRIRMIVGFMRRFVERTMPHFLPDWDPLVSGVIGEAESAIARLMNSSFDVAQVQKANSSEVLAHIEKVYAEYESVKPEFDRFKKAFSG